MTTARQARWTKAGRARSTKVGQARSKDLFGGFFTLILICVIGLGAAVAFSTISQADDGVVLPDNHPVEAESFRQVGAASPSLPLRMEIRFALRNKKGLQSLLDQLQNPAAKNYHHWLNSEEFLKRFGPSAAQVKAVAAWLRAEGFTVSRQSATAIEFAGAAGQAERTFRVGIAKFGDGTVYANTNDPVIPKRFAGLIGAVSGMDNMLHAVALSHRSSGPAGAAIGGTTSPNAPLQIAAAERDRTSADIGNPQAVVGSAKSFGPSDLRTFYDESVGAGSDGTGSCIAIVDVSDFLDSTMSTFTTQFGLPAISYSRVLEGSNPGIISGDDLESELDVQWAHVAAPGASIRFYLGSGLVDDITGAIDDNACGTISISYGFCGVSSSFMTQTMDPLFMRAAAQGQSVFVSAGDQGAAGLSSSGNRCVNNTVRSVNEMSADPNVTSVGGTGFNPDYVGANDQGYATESAWNDPAGSTGGGASQIFSKPAYQTGSGVPNDNARDVPDIALIASPYYPGVFWADDQNGSPVVTCCIGGTSLSAPLWAGFASVIGQQLGNRLGNLNLIIYPLANSSYATAGFHDVTSGNNNFNGVTGFSAGPSYDQTTGWGTVDFNLFANAVKTFVGGSSSPTPTGTPFATSTATATVPRTPTATPTGTPTPTSSITFVGSSALADFSTAVSNITLGEPSGIHSGDILLAQIIVYDGTASDVPAAPSGWTSIRHDAVNNGNKATSWLYYKVAGPSEPASYTWNISSNWVAGVMGAWRGASAIDSAAGSTATGSGSLSISAPSLTASNNNELQLFFYGAQSSAAPSVSPSNALTQRFNTGSSKEGFTLAVADHAAPAMNNASPAYPAIVSTGVATAQTILLIATSQSATPSPSATATTAPTATTTRTATATPTATATATAAATATPTITATAIPTAIATAIPTAFPTATATIIPTPTQTAIATPTATATPSAAGITFVGADALTDSSSAVSAISLGLPSGFHSGDILVAQIIVYDGSAADVPATPSGWTSIRHDAISNGNKLTSWLYYKVAGASEPASYTWNISSNWAAGVMGAWRGTSSSPIDAASGAATGSSSASVAAPSLTPRGSSELQIFFYASQSSSAPILTPSNALTQRFNARSSKEGFTLAYADLAAPPLGVASPTYSATANISGAVITAQAVLLIPAAH
jgi:hypothetical protein